jgi:hypothetical protein
MRAAEERPAICYFAYDSMGGHVVMHKIMIVGMSVVVASCGSATPTAQLVQPQLRCPDPASCTQSNGTGVYTAENGSAGIGPSALMITHFINTGASVRFEGRYRVAVPGQQPSWRLLAQPGAVVSADHDGETGLSVVEVTEGATTPTWTLQGPAGQPQQHVSDAGLKTLQLHISFDTVGDGTREYVIDFAGPPVQHIFTGRIVNHETEYTMQWAVPGRAPQIYCRDASGSPDTVVYQQGIDVEPVTGHVTHVVPATQLVTLSCYLGAPATVYRWGYDYERDQFHFDAGIPMKRASYCADASFYTRTGTLIHIGDEGHRSQESVEKNDVEAWWTPDGATCVNLDHLRYPTLGRTFKPVCKGRPVPPCPSQLPPPTPRWLIDGPAT